MNLDPSSDIPAKWQLIRSAVKQTKFSTETEWTDELANQIRGNVQDAGFYGAEVKVQSAQSGGEDFSGRHFTATVRVKLGSVYTLSFVRFSTWDKEQIAFPEATLRSLIPVQDGEIFRTDKIREGVNSLRKLYGSNGYIDFVSQPMTQPNEKNHTVSLMIWLDQERQFYIGAIEVVHALSSANRCFSRQRPNQLLARNCLCTGGLAGFVKIEISNFDESGGL